MNRQEAERLVRDALNSEWERGVQDARNVLRGLYCTPAEAPGIQQAIRALDELLK